jgi:hypothetical protein
MRTLLLVVMLVLGIGAVAMPSATEAGSRITCQCKTRMQSWVLGRYACEYHHQKAFRKVLGGGSKPVKSCSVKEGTAFKAKLCAEECAKKR